METLASSSSSSSFLGSGFVATAILFCCVTLRSVAGAGDLNAGFTSPLPTGVRLDPVGDIAELGSVPLGMALDPGGEKVAVVMSGWREQGLQIVDLKSRHP